MSTLPLTYYAQFRDAAGNLVTGTDGQTWFAIGGLSVDQETAVTFTGPGTAPTVVFNPLGFTLGTDSIDPVLLAAEAAGTVFSQIEVAGYSGSGSGAVLVTDDLYKNAALQATTASAGGMAVRIEYGDTVHRFYPTNPDGSAGAPVVAGYNRLSNAADVSTSNADGTPGHAPNAPVAGVPATTDTTAPLTFYVQFRDGNGLALSGPAGQTWFAVTALSVPAERAVRLGVNSGGSNAVVFDQMTFTVEGAALPMLLAQQAAGTAFGAVELAGYSGSGATAALIEDFVSRRATLASLATTADGSHSLSLTTTDLVQTVMPAASANGLPVAGSVTRGWNTANNTADNTADTRANLVGTPNAAPVSPLTYYVQFRDDSGALLAGDQGQTWFNAAGLAFGSEAVSGGGLSFDPLRFTLAGDRVLGQLFSKQSAGVLLRQVEVAGYDASGALVSDDVFKGAAAASVQANGDGTSTLTYGYQAMTDTSYRQNLFGQPVPSTQGYNAYSKMADTSSNTFNGKPGSAPDAPAAPPSTTPGASGLTYYVQFRNGKGVLLSGSGGSTWFAVTGLQNETLQAQTQPGGTNQFTFGGLSFTLAPDSVLPVLFQSEAAATPLQSVEVAGYAGAGPGATLVQDSLLKLVYVGSSALQPDGTTALTLQYNGLLETTYATDASGTTAATGAYGWNGVKNAADNTTTPISGTNYPLAAPLGHPPAVTAGPGALTYYLQIRDGTGALVTDAAGSTWLSVTNVSLPTSQDGGGPSQPGNINFGPASFTITDLSIIPKLFQAECSGAAFMSIELAGYGATGNGPVLVQDSVLKLAALSSIVTGSNSSVDLTVQYGGIVQRSYTATSAGAVTLAATGGWNKVSKVQDVGTGTIENPSASPSSTGGPTAPAAPLVGAPAGVAVAVPLTYLVQLVPQGTSASGPQTLPFLPISNLSFETEQTLNIGSQSTGAGAGRVVFDPLSFTIAPDAVSATLLQRLVADNAYMSVNIVGYDTSGPTPVKVVTNQFKLVQVSDLGLDGGGGQTVQMVYGGLTEKYATNGPGGVQASQPTGWNRIKNVDAADNGLADTGAPDNALPTAVCYCRGTLILTDLGERPIETLGAGDIVVTASGERRRVKWLGRTTMDCRDHADPAGVLPVRVREGAFGPGLPAADLWLSPGHAVRVEMDGPVLVRIGDLLNGATVVQELVETVEYLHLELDSHDILLANGMPAESYINVGNKLFFEEGLGLPDGTGLTVADYCHPLVLDEPALAVLRARVLARAAVLGWSVERLPVTPRLVVDGAVLEPEMEVDGAAGLARFVLPAGASEVWLHSPAFVPRHLGVNGDTRELGMAVNAIRLENGLSFKRLIPADDPALCVGFHRHNADEARLWTTGCALLPAALWEGCPGALFLTVVFEPGHCCPTWRQTGSVSVPVAAQPRLRLVHAA